MWLLALKFGNLENCFLCSLCTAASPLKRSRISFEEGEGGGGEVRGAAVHRLFSLFIDLKQIFYPFFIFLAASNSHIAVFIINII